MCAGSNAKLGNKEVGMSMDYYGGSLTLGKLTYEQNKDEKSCSAEEMTEALMKYKKKELISLMLDLIDNSDEG